MLDHFSLLPVPLGHIIIIAPLQWKWKWPLTGLAFPFLPCPDSVYLPLVSIALGWRHLPKNKRQNAWRMKQDFHMAGPLHYANISFCSPWNSLCWGFTGLPSVPTAEFSSVQSLSHVRLFATPQTAACQASRSITNSRSLLKFMSITSVMPSNHLIICHHLLLLLLQSFLLSGSFPLSQFFLSGGLSIGASASKSVLPMNIQDWFPLGITGWISLQSKGLSRVFSNITVRKHQFFSTQLSLQSNSHIHTWLLEKA